MKSLKLTASLVRILLAISLVAIFAAGAAGFVFAQKELLSYAKDISRLKVDADASNTTIASLEQVRTELQGFTDVSQKAQALRANDEFPEFRIIDEVRTIAQRNNIPIENFSYESPTADTTTPTQTPAATPTEPQAAASAAEQKTIGLTVNFKPIANYRNYLQFLYDIEQNIPKLKITSVGLTSAQQSAATDGSTGTPAPEQQSSGPSSDFTVEPLTLELYIR